MRRCVATWQRGRGNTRPSRRNHCERKEATVGEIEEPAALAEKEKGAVPQQEASQEERPEPETEPIEMPADSELQPSAEQSPTKNSAPEPTPSQPPKELQPGEKVYVAGFGWVEYEGPNYCEDGTGYLRKRQQNWDHGVKCVVAHCIRFPFVLS